MRRTVAAPVSLSGRGLHTGVPAVLRFWPAPSGAGIRFRRADRSGSPDIPALVEHVTDTARRTAIGSGDVDVTTVEHVLAAVFGLGIDDLIVELDGPEPPIMDGSALPFTRALRGAGWRKQDGEPNVLVVREACTVTAAGARYSVEPATALSLAVTIHWPHPMIACQRGCWTVGPDTFERELAPARTFGFVAERRSLRAAGLARGASPDNTILLAERDVINGPLRWPDEFVRHKALDLIGDLALLGSRLHAAITAERPSHAGNCALVEVLRAQSPLPSSAA